MADAEELRRQINSALAVRASRHGTIGALYEHNARRYRDGASH